MIIIININFIINYIYFYYYYFIINNINEYNNYKVMYVYYNIIVLLVHSETDFVFNNLKFAQVTQFTENFQIIESLKKFER